MDSVRGIDNTISGDSLAQADRENAVSVARALSAAPGERRHAPDALWIGPALCQRRRGWRACIARWQALLRRLCRP